MHSLLNGSLWTSKAIYLVLFQRPLAKQHFFLQLYNIINPVIVSSDYLYFLSLSVSLSFKFDCMWLLHIKNISIVALVLVIKKIFCLYSMSHCVYSLRLKMFSNYSNLLGWGGPNNSWEFFESNFGEKLYWIKTLNGWRVDLLGERIPPGAVVVQWWRLLPHSKKVLVSSPGEVDVSIL